MAQQADYEVILATAQADMTAAPVITAWGAALVPVTITFVLFSTARSRRHPIFWLQCSALVLAIAAAASELAAYIIDSARRFDGGGPFAWLQFTKEMLKWLVPWISDWALSLRILAFYPAMSYSMRQRASLMAFPVLIKIPRIIVIFIIVIKIALITAAGRSNWVSTAPFQIAELVMQICDGSYVSAILLMRIYRSAQETSVYGIHSSNSARRWRKIIIEGVLMSFLPAVLLQVAGLAVLATLLYRHGHTANLNIPQSTIFNCQIYLTIIMSIIATSWSSICNTASANRSNNHLSTEKSRSSGGSRQRDFDREGQVVKSVSYASVTQSRYRGHCAPEEQTLLYQLTHHDLSMSDDSDSILVEVNENKLSMTPDRGFQKK